MKWRVTLPPALGLQTTAACSLPCLFHHTAVFPLLVIIVGALGTVQIPNGVSAGLERDLMILSGLALLAFLGPGRFALSVKHLQVPIQQKTRLTAER